MTAHPASPRARTASEPSSPEGRSIDISAPTSRLVAFAAALVLAATTGLPLGSVADLMPRADDRAGPFLGI